MGTYAFWATCGTLRGRGLKLKAELQRPVLVERFFFFFFLCHSICVIGGGWVAGRQ